MIGEMREVESIEFQARFFPGSGLVLIEKDMKLESKWGRLEIPDTTVSRMNRYAACGTVLKASPFRSENPHYEYLMGLVWPGDHVAFSTEVPILAGAPPFYSIYKAGENGKKEKDATMLIHVADITGWIFETEQQRKAFMERINGAK